MTSRTRSRTHGRWRVVQIVFALILGAAALNLVTSPSRGTQSRADRKTKVPA